MYDGEDSDSGLRPKLPDFDFLKNYKFFIFFSQFFKDNNFYRLNKEDLYDVLNNCRVIKSPEEIQLMDDITKISSEAMKSSN